MRRHDNGDRRFQGGSGVEFDRILADARQQQFAVTESAFFSYGVPSAAHFYDWETPVFIMQSYLPKFMCRFPKRFAFHIAYATGRAGLDPLKTAFILPDKDEAGYGWRIA